MENTLFSQGLTLFFQNSQKIDWIFNFSPEIGLPSLFIVGYFFSGIFPPTYKQIDLPKIYHCTPTPTYPPTHLILLHFIKQNRQKIIVIFRNLTFLVACTVFSLD